MTALDEASMTEMLADWYGQNHGNGPRYAFAAQVRSHASFYARRTCDAIAMDLWARGRFALHGHEIKVSRSDWLAELKEPEKAAEFIPYVNYWWLVVADESIVRPGEMPGEWGLMAPALDPHEPWRRCPLRVVVRAPRHDALPLPPIRLAPLLRAVAQTSAYRAEKALRAEMKAVAS